MSVGKYRLDFTMCYLAVSPLLYFDYSQTPPSNIQPQFDSVNLLIQIYAKYHAPLSLSLSLVLLLHLACSMTAKSASVVTPC